MSDSVRPHRRQTTRLPRPWDSPGKNTGVGCHFLLQCTKVKSQSEVAQSCPTLSNPIDCSLPGSSIHGIFQARRSGVPLPSPIFSPFFIPKDNSRNIVLCVLSLIFHTQILKDSVHQFYILMIFVKFPISYCDSDLIVFIFSCG